MVVGCSGTGGGAPARDGNRRSRKAFQRLSGGPETVRAGAWQGAASDRSPSAIPASVAGVSPAAHRLIDDPDPATEDLAALQVEAYERVCFCRQALDAP